LATPHSIELSTAPIGPLVAIRRVERVLLATETVAIGEIRCDPSEPEFDGCDRLQNYFIGFPRSVCRIQRDDGPAYVSTSMVAPLFNVGSGYRRWPVGSAPENSMWIVVGEGTLREIVREFDAHGARNPSGSLLRFSAIPLARGCFEEAIAIRASARGPCDPMEIEERAVSLVVATLRIGYSPFDSVPGKRVRSSTRGRHRRIVEDAKAFVAATLPRRVSLSDIGRAAGASPFHLSRVFRIATGRSLSAYANELRIRTAVSMLEERSLDLTTMAFQLGFASLSHFSSTFKRLVTESPQAYRWALMRGGPWSVQGAGAGAPTSRPEVAP
jgi:AraC-like DNA-binding protein